MPSTMCVLTYRYTNIPVHGTARLPCTKSHEWWRTTNKTITFDNPGGVFAKGVMCCESHYHPGPVLQSQVISDLYTQLNQTLFSEWYYSPTPQSQRPFSWTGDWVRASWLTAPGPIFFTDEINWQCNRRNGSSSLLVKGVRRWSQYKIKRRTIC